MGQVGKELVTKRVTNRHGHRESVYMNVICLKASTSLISDFFTKQKNAYKKLKEPTGIKINVNNWGQKQPHLRSV